MISLVRCAIVVLILLLAGVVNVLALEVLSVPRSAWRATVFCCADFRLLLVELEMVRSGLCGWWNDLMAVEQE